MLKVHYTADIGDEEGPMQVLIAQDGRTHYGHWGVPWDQNQHPAWGIPLQAPQPQVHYGTSAGMLQ